MKAKLMVLVIVVAAIAAAPVLADVVVDRSSGVVQYRLPNDSQWRALEAGLQVPEGTTVISGADGAASLTAGNSTITVAPLSRVVLDTVSISPTREVAELDMPYGRVQAQVRRGRNRGMDFRVYTPVSTAAVRGTEFIFDGRSLEVTEGDVAYSNLSGQNHSVRAGQVSRTWGTEPIESVEATMVDQLDF